MNEKVIHQVPLFSALPPSEIELLASTLQPVTYEVGVNLFLEGERGDHFYIVLQGQVAIIKALGTADERFLAIRGAGDFVGEMSLLNQDGLRTATAQVREKVTVLELTRTEFDALLHRHPTMAYQMLRVLSDRLRASHNSAIHDLQLKNQQLLRAYEELKAAQAQLIEKEALERELQRAREIQISMLPTILPYVAGCEVGARMVPARMVGGDFYDVMLLEKNRLGVVVGDVSGKGVPAALFMALTRSLLRAEAGRCPSPEAVLRNVNRHLLGMNAKGMFVTVLYGELDVTNREFVYARAGHDLPLIWSQTKVLKVVPPGRGQPLGLFRQPVLDVQTLQLEPGDTMLLYSDGVTEAVNSQNEYFDEAGLQTAVFATPFVSAQALCDNLVETLESFHGPVSQADDITLLTLKLSSAA